MPLDDKLQGDILSNISLMGSAEQSEAVVIPFAAELNPGHILDITNGTPKIKASLVKKFKLILSRPIQLTELHNTQVRCTLCKRVIGYPCWYHSVKYAVNVFHFFVCFDSTSSTKPSVKCYRKG